MLSLNELHHEKTCLWGFRQQPGYTGTEDSEGLEISDLGSRGIVQTKALISFALTAKLICAIVFAYAKSSFPHEVTQICQAEDVKFKKGITF